MSTGIARVLQYPLWASWRVRVEVRGDINSILYYRSPWTLANFGEGIDPKDSIYYPCPRFRSYVPECMLTARSPKSSKVMRLSNGTVHLPAAHTLLPSSPPQSVPRA